MFKKGDFKKIKNQGSIVFKSDLLKDLTPFERHELLQLCHRRKYKEGEFIYYQNDPGAGMYFIEEGRVKLTVSKPDDSTKPEQYTMVTQAPSEFGIMSIGYEIPRLATAQCLTDCTLLGFFKSDFETLKKRHPETAVKFLEAVSTQTMKRFEMSIKKLKERVDLKTAFSVLFEDRPETKEEV